jgi:hypothetical protein
MTVALMGLASSAMANAKPVPLINQPLVPDAVAPGGPAFTLTLNGTGFVSKSVVNWNGGLRTTVFISRSQLTASITAADIAVAGTASITVVNPAPTSGTSNVVFLPITLPTSSAAFSLGASPQTGTEPVSVATADFNGDGKLDLAVANYASNTISILLGGWRGQLHLGLVSRSG